MTERKMSGDAVMAYLEAREILALIGPDPEAGAHRLALGKEIGDICHIGDCYKPSRANGMCDAHYRAHRRATQEAFLINQLAKARADEKDAKQRVHLDDIDWLLECDPSMTTAQLANRFRVTPDAIKKVLRRAGRTDLLDRLARNAELAGHNVTSRRTA